MLGISNQKHRVFGRSVPQKGENDLVLLKIVTVVYVLRAKACLHWMPALHEFSSLPVRLSENTAYG